jgi:hypothetical protein
MQLLGMLEKQLEKLFVVHNALNPLMSHLVGQLHAIKEVVASQLPDVLQAGVGDVDVTRVVSQQQSSLLHEPAAMNVPAARCISSR